MVALSLLGVVLSLFDLSRIRPPQVPTVEQLVPKSAVAELRDLRAQFAVDDDTLLVAIQATDDLTDDRIRTREQQLRELPQVASVLSAVSRPRLRVVSLEPPKIEWAKDTNPNEPPSDLDRLLRPDAQTAILVVTPTPAARSLEGARSLVAGVRHTLAVTAALHETSHVFGAPTARVGSWRQAQRDLKRMLPVLVLGALLVPFMVFRTVGSALFPLCIAALTTAATMILYRYAEGPPTPLVLVLIPLVWSVATLDAMHLYHRARIRSTQQPSAPMGSILAELLGPCLVTSVTTASGLVMLAVLGQSPLLRIFGLWGAVGTALAFACTFVLGPSFLAAMPSRSPPPRGPTTLMLAMVDGSQRRWMPVALVWIGLTALAIAALPRLSVRSSYPRIYGNAGDQPVAAMQTTLGTDLMPLQLYLEATEPRRRQPGQLLSATIRLTHYMKSLDETTHALSAATLLDELITAHPEAHRLLRGPTLLPDLGRITRELETDSRVTPWLDLDRGRARVEVHLRPTDHARKMELLAWIRHFDETMLDGYRVVVGGPGFLYPQAEQLGWTGALRGGLATLGLLVVVAAITMRRLALVLITLAGNLIPVVVLGGLMVAVGIPWSLGLLAIPVVLISLAVDDTVHLLWPIRNRGADLRAELHAAVTAAGPAILATTLVLTVCLGALGLSGLQVNRQLGGLFAAGVLLALVCDLTLVPALLSALRYSARRRVRP